jgi:dTDP-4-dehydrorhamnose 3,5-epimerase-like enzyme
MSKNRLWLLIALVAIGLIGYASIGFAHEAVTLKDAAGNAIQGGSSTPYSPKQTCGGCHDYESDPVIISKHQRFADGTTESYNVIAPKHGVTKGFHFQQGRDVPWGDTQRNFYKVPGFTSSPGMWGKY